MTISAVIRLLQFYFLNSISHGLICRKLGKGVEYLVEASAAEAEAITAALAAAKARQQGNGEVELPDRDGGAEATPSGKAASSSISLDSSGSNNSAPTGVRLHHRAVSIQILYAMSCYLVKFGK